MKTYRYKLSFAKKTFSAKLVSENEVKKIYKKWAGIVFESNCEHFWIHKIVIPRILFDRYVFYSLVKLSEYDIARYVFVNYSIKNKEKKEILRRFLETKKGIC